MIDHTGIGVADVGRSAAFYDAVLGALDLGRVMQLAENEGTDAIGYGVDYQILWIDRFHLPSVSQHVAFAAKSRADVETYHAATFRAGATDNLAPGLREWGYPPKYYAAFVLDPDGHNREAVFREA